MMTKVVEDMDRDEATGNINWQPAIYTALYVYRASPHHATGVSPAYLLYGKNISLPFLYTHQQPDTSRDQVTHKKQIQERLEYTKERIPGVRRAHHKFARIEEVRKILIRPIKYSVDDGVLMRNPKNNYTGYGSAFASPFIGPYKVYSSGDKGQYRLQTIPKRTGKKAGLMDF
jgi:hypothetical protein